MSNKSNMTNCKNCNWQIAKVAKFCPKCGAKNKKPFYKHPIPIIFIYFIFMAFVGAMTDIEGINSNIINDSNTTESTVQEPSSQEISSNTTENNTVLEENIKEKEIINLKFNDIGNYGKKDNYNIRYYIPSGKYNVTCNSETSSGFFIIKNEKVKNSEGKLEDVIIEDIRFDDTNITKEIEIPQDTHIVLFASSDFNFKK